MAMVPLKLHQMMLPREPLQKTLENILQETPEKFRAFMMTNCTRWLGQAIGHQMVHSTLVHHTLLSTKEATPKEQNETMFEMWDT